MENKEKIIKLPEVAPSMEIVENLARVVQLQYEYITWLTSKMTLAQCAPEMGDMEDGSDVGSLGVVHLDFEARVALKQFWSGQVMKGTIGAPRYEELLKIYNKKELTMISKTPGPQFETEIKKL